MSNSKVPAVLDMLRVLADSDSVGLRLEDIGAVLGVRPLSNNQLVPIMKILFSEARESGLVTGTPIGVRITKLGLKEVENAQAGP